MATGVQWLKSTDGSAPTLSGTAGDLTTLWDALLVNGFGSKSAMGTGGAGAWTIDKTGTNKRIYRPSAGNRFYLRCQDDAPSSATDARVVGYETVSTVDAGTNPMPTVAQSANGLFIRKSAAANATTRAWKALGDDRTFYFFNISGDVASCYTGFGWGDFYSHLSADGYRTTIIGRNTEASSSMSLAGSVEWFPIMIGTGSTFAGGLGGHYIQRSRSGVAGAINVNKTCAPGLGITNAGTVAIGNIGSIAYPNAEDGGLYILPLYLHDVTTAPTSSIRGRLRGLWCTLHPTSAFSDGDTFSGVGDYAGKTFEIIKGLNSSTGGVLVVETSDTWDTSS